MKLAEYSTAPDQYKRRNGITMHTVILVDGWNIDRVRIRDGVALSQQVLDDAMSRAGWKSGEYCVTGGNGWVTAYAGGRAVISAHVASRHDQRGYERTAPAHEMNRG